MSRIAKNSIKINKEINCKFENGLFFAKGKLGEKSLNINSSYTVEINNEELDRNELYKGIMWKLSTGNGAISTPAPSLGQDNDHILRNLLKYSDNEVDNFERRGII